MRRILSFLLVTCILLGISLPTKAEETEMKKIVLRDEDGIKLSISLETDETHYFWNVHYENNQEEVLTTSLRINHQEEYLRFQENQNWIEQDDNWIKITSDEIRESNLNLITAKEVTSLTIELMFNNDITQISQYSIEDNQFYSEDQNELINDIIKTEDETIIVIDDISKLEAVTEEILDISRGINKPYTDPFKYTEDVSGKYPTHGSNSFVSDNRTIIKDSKTTKNFDYGTSHPNGQPDTINAYGKNLDFLSGYHYFPNIDDNGQAKDGVGLLSKKTVKPTNDPNKFDLEVDIIGGATPIKNQVDVMLIIDKSASMNDRPDGSDGNKRNSRWALLKIAVGNLATNLLTKDNDIQIGMTSFGSKWSNSTTTHIWTEVANFNTTNSPVYFTKDPAIVKGNSILSGDLTPSGSGTPTFLGIQSGMETTQTYGRPNALKFVILVTDGVSTFGPGTNFNSLSNRTTLVKSSNNNGVYTYQFENKTGDQLYIGTGFETGNDNKPLNPLLSTITTRTLEHFTALKSKDIYKDYKYMSLGFTTIKESKPPKTEEPATQMNILLNAFQNTGRFNAIDQKELNKAFEEIKRRIAGYEGIFVLGELVDPMSEYVTLVKDSLKTSALTLKYDDINKNYSGITPIPKHNIDGSANENFPDYANDIVVNKPSIDDQSMIHLSDMNLGSSGNDRMGFRINYTVELKEGFRDGKFHQANNPTRAVAFNFTNPVGFAVPSVRVPDRNFDFKKVGEDGIALKGAKFGINIKGKQEIIQTVVSDASGNVSFTGLKAGTYELKELEAPPGYQLLTDPVEFTIVHGSPPYKAEMTVIIDDKYKENGNIVIKNQMKPYSLKVTKVDANHRELIGSSFNLSNQDKSYDKTIHGANSSIFDFAELKWGTYTLIETKSPPGYVIMKPVVIVINKDGTVTIDGSPSNSIANIIEFTAVNYQKGMLPSTGSTQMNLYTAIPIALMVLASTVGLYGVYRRRRYRL